MQPNLKLFLNGFQLFEKRIIETTVRLSKNRTPSLVLLNEQEHSSADVLIIDCLDTEAMQWAKLHEQELVNRTVIWVDGNSINKGQKHVRMNRPILWVNLPITLARIFDDFSLQEQESIALAAEKTHQETIPKNNKSNILVVDDSQAVRDYLSKVLKRSGYKVDTAESGDDAIEIIKDKHYDCVLMDVLMPGIDGYKACREIRRSKTHGVATAVVMLTSKTSPFDKIRGKMAGCDAYLTKPVKIQVLLETVKSYIANN